MGKKSSIKVPILMYHQIADPYNNNPESGHYRVTPEVFYRQMLCLKLAEYQTITMSHLGKYYKGERPLPVKPIVITFDDGYVDTYINAMPVLRELNYTATVYLVADYIGKSNLWDQTGGHPKEELMDADMIKELIDQGIDLGAHTFTHPHLTLISREQATREIRVSREYLEDTFGVAMDTFAYPYGPTSFNKSIRKIVIDSGYLAACNTYPASNYTDTDPYNLYRFWSRNDTSIPDLIEMLYFW